MLYFDNFEIAIIVLSILLGAIVKGVLGMGLPMIAVPMIAFILPPTKAMILLCFPILSTNFIQMQIHKGIGSYRFCPLLIMLVIGIVIGGRLILEFNTKTIAKIIAFSIIFAALTNFFEFKIQFIKKRFEVFFTIFLGFFSGILGGLSTFYGPPILAYLISVKLEKEFFIRTVATMYFLGSIPLYGSLLYHGLGTIYDLILSFFLILPSLIGQYFGTKIRRRLSNDLFRKFTLFMLIIIGLTLLLKNL